MKRFLLIALTAVSILSNVAAQDSTLTRLLTKHHFSLNQQKTDFSGAGWDSLQRAMAKAQFVLVGEQHGLAEVPLFTGALAKAFNPKLYVAEVDPHTAREIERLAEQPNLPVAFERKYPFSLSFYSWAEEFELARQLRKQKAITIGLDQVNFSATGRLFAQLAQAAKGKAAKKYLQERAAAYQAQDMAFFKNPDNSQPAITLMAQSAVDSLLLVTQKEKPQVRKMAQDYAKSYEIYQLVAKGASNSHSSRVNMMKRNLLLELQPHGLAQNQLPKMLFKFGAGHMERGLNRWNVFDVGNLAVNLADAQDQKTLHIMVVGKEGGTQGGFNLDFSKNQANYPPEALAYLAPYQKVVGTSAWSVFDLRPTRRALITNRLKLDESDLKSMIMGYDYLVIIPTTTAATNI